MVAAEKKDTVDVPSLFWKRQLPTWDLIDDLMGGTRAMREAGSRWLPQEPDEKGNGFQTRLERSVLYEGLKDTISKVVAKPFSHPIKFEDPDELDDVLAVDADRDGTSASEFWKDVFREGAAKGLSHVFVDMPSLSPNDFDAGGQRRQRSLAEEDARGIRPYLVHIKPRSLIGGRVVDGALVELRIHSTRVVRDGAFAEREEEVIRVYREADWEEWILEADEEDETKEPEYVKRGEGVNELGKIPLVSFYTRPGTGRFEAEPPFEGLAWLNVAHWQSQSDQRNLLRVARVPLLETTGFTKDELDKKLTISIFKRIGSTKSARDVRVKWIEIAAVGALEAGDKDLRSLERKMEILGLQPFIERADAETATGKSLDEERNDSSIKSWLRNLEDAIVDAHALAHEWMNRPASSLKPNVFSDFGLSVAAVEDIKVLIELRKNGDLDRRTLLEEVKRRGRLADSVDVEKVIAAVETEGPPLPVIGLGEEDDDEEEQGSEAA